MDNVSLSWVIIDSMFFFVPPFVKVGNIITRIPWLMLLMWGHIKKNAESENSENRGYLGEKNMIEL